MNKRQDTPDAAGWPPPVVPVEDFYRQQRSRTNPVAAVGVYFAAVGLGIGGPAWVLLFVAA